MNDRALTIKHGFKLAVVENVAIIVLSVLALLTLLLATVYAPKPVTFDSIKVIHNATIKQYIYMLLLFYLCVYGVSLMITNNKVVTYTKHVICSKHVFASIILIVCYTAQVLSFCFFKNSIPYINFYSWDNIFIKLDWLLLFKNHPWVVVKNIVPNFEMIEIYNHIYLSWIPITGLILFWQQITIDRDMRRQYLTSLLATWLVLGCWCAAIFSSVGPCFYEFFYDKPPYIIGFINSHLEPLGSNLTLLTSLSKQALLSNYFNTTFLLGFGISAFPSLHIAITVINVLAITKRFKKITIFAWCYTFLIMLSCIYLGFHYLVDCIFGLLGALAIWCLTTRLYASSWFNNWQNSCK
jgi:membrane-associated phospholipid phosphatase